ncbi:MAG: VWA domain-containing protein, partial [Gammaproteobacteria bacterium HGW-Gammaproteobacteria-6]
DVSASMLDETVVGVIRARNMDAATQRASAKWRWALNALDWITTQVPATAQFQVYAFNTTVESAVAGTTGNWLAVGNGAQLSAAVSDLRQRLPTGGTSLTRAFAAAARLSPQPDNIYLLTDGLPTQGAAIRGGLVSGDQRMDLFAEALRAMPRGIAIHTLLFPMDGDSKAAGAYWQLAQISGGSFLAPSRDWP